MLVYCLCQFQGLSPSSAKIAREFGRGATELHSFRHECHPHSSSGSGCWIAQIRLAFAKSNSSNICSSPGCSTRYASHARTHSSALSTLAFAVSNVGSFAKGCHLVRPGGSLTGVPFREISITRGDLDVTRIMSTSPMFMVLQYPGHNEGERPFSMHSAYPRPSVMSHAEYISLG